MPDQGDLQVHGGAGGVAARLEDVVRAGSLLRSVAGELADHGRDVLAVSADPRLHVTALQSPLTFAQAEAALTVAVVGPNGLFAGAARAEALGAGAVGVAGAYRAADALAARALRAAATTAGRAIGTALAPLVPGALLAGAAIVTVVVLADEEGDDGPVRNGRGLNAGGVNAGGLSAGGVDDSAAGDGVPGRGGTLSEPLRRVGGLTLQLLAENAGLTEALVPVLPGVIGGLSMAVPGGQVIAAGVFGRPAGPATVSDVAAGLGVIGGLVAAGGGPALFRESGEVQVRAVPLASRRPAAGAGELLARVPASRAGRPQIHVERIDATDGRRWIVSVPGTADWSPVAGGTPFDLTGDVRLMAGERTAGMAAVVEAMRATGVRKGEPVLLVGHSQGGLIAAATAADRAVDREFSVTHVLTSGAPVASIPVPERVQVLSVEHSDDLVPRLDGAPNRDRPSWITVTAPAPLSGLPAAERSEPLLAHRAGLYQQTADRIDSSTDPSLEVWRAGVAPFLDAPGRSGAGWDVEVSRMPR